MFLVSIRLTLGLTFVVVQPGACLERNQSVLAHPRQAVDFPAPDQDELVVRIVEQDRGQARHRLVDGNRREVTSFGQPDPLGSPAEQLEHGGKAIIGRLLESIEDRLPGVAGLSDFVAARLDEAPERFAE
ncbi:MAG TPA: hypothetical protein PJ986_19745 [Gammaproteobacteria bacterium]|nr:hypothetical protein [Gammaproteobacteria bacterium]